MLTYLRKDLEYENHILVQLNLSQLRLNPNLPWYHLFSRHYLLLEV